MKKQEGVINILQLISGSHPAVAQALREKEVSVLRITGQNGKISIPVDDVVVVGQGKQFAHFFRLGKETIPEHFLKGVRKSSAAQSPTQREISLGNPSYVF